MAEMRDAFKKAGYASRGPQKKCEECGRLFAPTQPHHKKCSDCIGKRKADELRARGIPVPDGYPDYFAPDQTLRPEYLTELAEAIAESLGRARPELTKNQLRAFYAHAKRREASVRGGRPWAEVYTELVKMVPIAGERAAKGIIPREFAEFIRRNVEKSKDQTAFLEGFIEHFQAVVAYCAGTLRKS